MQLGRGVQLKISRNFMGKLKCKASADLEDVVVIECEGFFDSLIPWSHPYVIIIDV